MRRRLVEVGKKVGEIERKVGESEKKVRESETKLGRKQVEGREKVRVKLGKSEEKVCVEVE